MKPFRFFLQKWLSEHISRVPNERRERLVRAFEDEHEDYPLAADTLGVNRSTAYKAKYVREGRIHERARGGRNNV